MFRGRVVTLSPFFCEVVMKELFECLQNLGFKNAAKSLIPDADFVELKDAELAVLCVLSTYFKGETPLSSLQEVSREYRSAESRALHYVDSKANYDKSQLLLDAAYRELEEANKFNDRELIDEALKRTVKADRLHVANRLSLFEQEDDLHKLAVSVEPYNPGYGMSGESDR